MSYGHMIAAQNKQLNKNSGTISNIDLSVSHDSISNAVGSLSENINSVLNNKYTTKQQMHDVINVISNEILPEIESIMSEIGVIAQYNALTGMLKDALAGDIQLVTSIDEDVEATALNAADASTIIHTVTVKAVTSYGRTHYWLDGFQPVLTPVYNGADVDIVAPVLNSPSFVKGVLTIEVTPDTDAGLTKTYLAAESYQVTVDVTGLPITSVVPNLVKTFNVI